MNFRLENVSKEFSGKTLFQEISVSCNPFERIGLLGRNGSGKTTLLDIIDGTLQPDSGKVHRLSRLTISRVSQLYKFDESKSVLSEALTAFDSLHAMNRRLRELEIRMADISAPDHDSVTREYEVLTHKFEFFGGYDFKSRTEKMLLGLGFTKASIEISTSSLSGGQKNRLALAKALLEPADVLLLDEPTNHLDLEGIFWLARFLSESVSSFVLISHDRSFLDKVTNKTWELESGRMYEYAASYSRSREIRRVQLQLQEREYSRQQEWKARTEDYIRRNMAGQKTKQAQSRLKQLRKTDWIEIDRDTSRQKKSMAIKIPPAPRGGAQTFSLRRAEIGFPGFSLINDLNLNVYRGERIGLLGGNGSGKSTLMKIIAGELPLLSGDLEWGSNNVISHFAQEARFDNPEMKVMDWIASLNPSWDLYDIYSFAALFHFRQQDTEKKIGVLSGGERSRLRFARLFSSPANVMLLDEPTNHLDIEGREALELALQGFQGTMIVISHDLYFMKQVAEKYFIIRNKTLCEIQDLDNLDELIADSPVRENSNGKSAEWKDKEGLSKNQLARLEKIIREAEEEIEKLESEKLELSRKMQQGTDDHRELAEMGIRFEKIEEEESSLMAKWEAAHSKLDNR
jgi:ATP-binding cassette subfamily F protein 3